MGPLTGLRVLEIASAAPAPFACMMLADMGADVLRVDRPLSSPPSELTPDPALDPLGRGRQSICLDLKSEEGRAVVRLLAESADVLVEGFRPGVMERLGLAPDDLLASNPRLVVARMTGWGQTGPLAGLAGHDINYIGIAGALNGIGLADAPPSPPLNLVGDFGGGGMLLTVGILAALVERASSGNGQIVDAAMIDGAALLTASVRGMLAAGTWVDGRGDNLLDGGAPFYATYETADGGYMSVGCLEPQFYQLFLKGLDLNADDLPARMDRANWPELTKRFARAFKQRSRDQWTATFAGTDACVFPVLSWSEVPEHEQVRTRRGFAWVGDSLQPAPAPRFSRTPSEVAGASPAAGQHAMDALRGWKLDQVSLEVVARTSNASLAHRRHNAVAPSGGTVE
jgi:alpha-methylacyl-CoA racemase